MIDDAELVRLIATRDGAREAEGELCRRFAPRIRLYGLRHLRTEDRAADLVQSVLLVVLEAARKGAILEPEHVDRFVLGTCRNIAMRTRKVEARTQTDTSAPDVAIVPNLERIDVPALMRCMEHLEARERTILLLSFQAEKGADEIGTSLEMTAVNVRVVRHRALAQLRRCLDGART